MVYSDSGVACLGCIFVTELDGEAIWTVSRYEPPHAIGFVIVRPGLWVQRLEVSVTPRDGQRSALSWRREYTALGQAGHEQLRLQLDERFDPIMSFLAKALDHYCQSGAILLPDGAHGA